MAETLASLIDRCEVFLADSTNKSWPTDTITECIRYALAEINKAAGATYTIDDLDAAEATTLPDKDLPALILGTAAYCARNRAVDRMEKINLGEGPEKNLSAWGNWAEKRFNELLKTIKWKAMTESTSAPHAEMTWTEDPHEW